MLLGNIILLVAMISIVSIARTRTIDPVQGAYGSPCRPVVDYHRRSAEAAKEVRHASAEVKANWLRNLQRQDEVVTPIPLARLDGCCHSLDRDGFDVTSHGTPDRGEGVGAERGAATRRWRRRAGTVGAERGSAVAKAGR